MVLAKPLVRHHLSSVTFIPLGLIPPSISSGHLFHPEVSTSGVFPGLASCLQTLLCVLVLAGLPISSCRNYLLVLKPTLPLTHSLPAPSQCLERSRPEICFTLASEAEQTTCKSHLQDYSLLNSAPEGIERSLASKPRRTPKPICLWGEKVFCLFCICFIYFFFVSALPAHMSVYHVHA